MKKGGYRRAVAGFTIVETLIVLAVTAGILISALIAINGRTSRTQFTTATNDLKQQLQQAINETTNGYFPNNGNFKCVKGTPPALTDLPAGSQAQGTNGECIFLGKVLQFGVHGDPDHFLAYTIAGNRYQPGTNLEITQLPQAWPQAVARGNGTNSGLTGVTVSNNLEGGITASKMTYVDATSGATVQTNGFAALSTLASYTSATGCDGICSGGQGVTLYAIHNSTSTNVLGSQDSPTFVDLINADSAGSYTRASSISICFNSGSTNQSALYTIGDVGNAQSVTMTVQAGSCP